MSHAGLTVSFVARPDQNRHIDRNCGGGRIRKQQDPQAVVQVVLRDAFYSGDFLGSRRRITPDAVLDEDLIANSVDQLARQIVPGAFPILLAHHPHAFDAAAARGVPLTVSGHTHGGQLMLGNAVGFAITHLRGVGSSTIAPGVENPIAIYVDGVYQASTMSGFLDFIDVDNVQVVGPQG